MFIKKKTIRFDKNSGE